MKVCVGGFRLQQYISTGDVDAVRAELLQKPVLEEGYARMLWFEVFHSQRSPAAVELLRCLVEVAGVDPSIVDDVSVSGLHLACSHCLKDCVEYLLGLEKTCVNEADVFGMLPLHHAISMCKTQVALEGDMDGLRSSSDSLRTSSDFSITQNDLPAAESVVSLLIDNGARVNLVDCTDSSSSRPPSYTTPLCFAVDIGNVRVVEVLLKAGALVNPGLGRGDGTCPKGCPPLQCALDNTDLVLAVMLVQHGAQCDARLKDGSYLIHHYCAQGNLPAVQFLLSHHVTVNQVGGLRRQTPFHVAASHGHANVMELLLARGAVIPERTAPSLFINTVLSGSVAAVQLLLDHGLSANTTSSGVTPLFVACGKSVDMVRVLLSSGADPRLGLPKYQPVCNVLLNPRFPVPDSVAITRELILYNADMNVCVNSLSSDVSRPLLHRALTSGCADMVELLLSTAVVRVRGVKDTMLALFRHACEEQRPDVVRLVEYYRRNPCSLSQQARTAIRRYIPDVSLIRALPLPPPLMDYVLYTDLNLHDLAS